MNRPCLKSGELKGRNIDVVRRFAPKHEFKRKTGARDVEVENDGKRDND
jgi:hypothetical protein